MHPGLIVLALVALVLGAAGGPGWSGSTDALLAAHFERSASAPLYHLVASVALRMPIGEPGFRLALLNAVLGAIVLAGVLRAVRAQLPSDPVAGVTAAILLIFAAPFRDAAGFAGPAMLAACGAVWAFALGAIHARGPSRRVAAGALACAAVAIGSAPWLGVALAVMLVAWLGPTANGRTLALAIGGVGLALVGWWAEVVGELPAVAPDLARAIARSGGGATAVVVGAGLLGAMFAAVTGLPAARWLVVAIALAAAHAIVVDPQPVALLALLAIGCAVLPGAVVRFFPSARGSAPRRHLIGVAGGLPLVLAAVLAGPSIGVDDPGAAPAELAADLVGELPPGPGVVIAGDPVAWSAIEYAQGVAGARPDLTLAAPIVEPTREGRRNAMRGLLVAGLLGGRVVGADGAAFVFLDPPFAVPRGRAFQIVGGPTDQLSRVRAPAKYPSAIGDAQAIELALARARFEATRGRLDAAARAAGLASRFGAADLALLAAAVPTRDRPAFFGFVPHLGGPPRAQLDLLGDDLAWVAGLEPPEAAEPERRLHALWRKLWAGGMTADDPAIAALGPAAVAATREMLATLKR